MAGVHDSLVKFLFTHPTDAASALSTVLPQAISARLDWTSLRHTDLSLVDPKLTEYYSDLVFSVACDGHEAFLYVLVEHQSSPDTLMAFRLLRYIVLIWGSYLNENPGASRIPAVLPIVLHHGEAGWSLPTELTDIIDLPRDVLETVRDFVPRFRFVVDDLATVEDHTLRERSLTAMMTAGLVLLKKGRQTENLVADLSNWLDVFVQVGTAPNGLDALRVLMEYVSRVANVEPDNVKEFARAIGPTAEEAYVTAAQKLAEQGRAEGRAELLLRQLSLRFGDVTDEVTRRVHAGSAEQLDLWAERVLSAQSLDEVFRDS